MLDSAFIAFTVQTNPLNHIAELPYTLVLFLLLSFEFGIFNTMLFSILLITVFICLHTVYTKHEGCAGEDGPLL